MADYDEQDVNTRVLGKFTLSRKDPFGFWVIETTGKLPPELDQMFTSTEMARNAIASYEHKTKVKTRKVG